MKRLFISFSGGETSARMANLLLTRWRSRWDEVVCGIANTGEENEETLVFADQCDRAFGMNLVWIEALVDPRKMKGTTHKAVTFHGASRKGEPFEEVIKKYGLPGPGRFHCTRELKLNPMKSYLASIGWQEGSYDTAIGIRADEPRRRRDDAAAERIIYPLLDWWPTTKPEINQFWMAQRFRLVLTGYQGNCKWCWKKSTRKHMTLLSEDPSKYDFPERMDRLYGTVGDEFDRRENEYPYRTMFRGSLTTRQLRDAYEANKETLEKAEDDSIVLPNNRRLFLDNEDGECMEACEIMGKAA